MRIIFKKLVAKIGQICFSILKMSVNGSDGSTSDTSQSENDPKRNGVSNYESEHFPSSENVVDAYDSDPNSEEVSTIVPIEELPIRENGQSRISQVKRISIRIGASIFYGEIFQSLLKNIANRPLEKSQ